MGQHGAAFCKAKEGYRFGISHCSPKQTRGIVGVLSATISSRLCVPISLCIKILRRYFKNKNCDALLVAPNSPTRLGTAHAFALLCLLTSLPSAVAQEDVAETKAT